MNKKFSWWIPVLIFFGAIFMGMLIEWQFHVNYVDKILKGEINFIPSIQQQSWIPVAWKNETTYVDFSTLFEINGNETLESVIFNGALNITDYKCNYQESVIALNRRNGKYENTSIYKCRIAYSITRQIPIIEGRYCKSIEKENNPILRKCEIGKECDISPDYFCNYGERYDKCFSDERGILCSVHCNPPKITICFEYRDVK